MALGRYLWGWEAAAMRLGGTGGEQLRRARRPAEKGRVGGQGSRSYFSLCVQSEEGLKVLMEGDYDIVGRRGCMSVTL